MIAHGGRELIVRLYYVDCPETTAASATDARRVRAQTRYFGLSGHDRTVHFGREATAFTRERLARPFTVHTAFATAPGRSARRRFYAFVTTQSGEDLAALLVKHGYARAYGVRRGLPDGTPRDEAAARLADTEVAAMLDRRGIWAETDAARLVELRATARQEEAELARIARDAAGSGRLDLNSVSEQALMAVPGIGPATARRIVELRPFRGPQDLARVPRLSSTALTNLLKRARFD
jgi:endonuclease YncB( thermonuclease family)